MPMPQPPRRRRAEDAGCDVGGGGQVLDLETAVKDGVLGGGGGGGNGALCGGDAAMEKLDLKTLIEGLRSVEIPSVFICPISLEPMQDPVTLCTGQTYERSNILKWVSLGRCTCPTTMQELWDDSLTPNRTLRHLIHSWFCQKYLAMKKRSEDVQGRVLELLETLKRAKGQARVQALKELRRVAAAHSSARRAVGDNGGVALLTSLLGPFTSYAVGSEAIGILASLPLNSGSRASLMEPAKVSLMVDMLNEGCNDTKLNCATLIGSLIQGDDSWLRNVRSLRLLVGLLRLVRDRRHPDGVRAGLGLMRTMIQSDELVGISFVGVGAVPQLVELLLLPCLVSEVLEVALAVLEALSSLPEGAAALRMCRDAIPAVVRVLMRVSESCTRLGLSILWAICKLDPEECASAAVEAGLAAKLLLVIQSGCDPLLKQSSAELLKLCSLNYTSTIFISKCKLTRTMQ